MTNWGREFSRPQLYLKEGSDVLKHRILVAFLIAIISITTFGAFFQPDIRPGYGVTDFGWLSDYFAPLKGSNLDTPLYFMDSGVPGPTFLYMGGTHAREISGTTAAIVFIENVVVKSGRVIVMPFSNSSAISVKDTYGKVPHFIQIESKTGLRFLAYGDRRTDLNDQKISDPLIFKHAQSDFTLEDGAEARNLNRQYPGVVDGNPTQQLAYAIIELIKKENVDFNLDMHESGTPETYTGENGNTYGGSRLAYTLVCHPEGLEIGAVAIMTLEAMTDISMKLEESNADFRGLSHLEIGNATNSISFLSETPNPGQDTWRKNPDVINDSNYPLKHRVGLQLEIVANLFESYNMFSNSLPIEVDNLPTYFDVMENGVGAYLN